MRHMCFAERKSAVRLVCAAAVLALAGCKQQPKKVQVQQSAEPASNMASELRMGDAKTEPQLTSGFYGIEAGAWRWTARQFGVVLRVPAGAAQRGATLEFDFTIPDVVVQKEKSVTLSASVDGNALPPETYSRVGTASYRRDIPAGALGGDNVKVNFTLDKAMPPAGGDRRELGVVATSVRLAVK